ncbi:MAG: hypothetical protein GX352_04000 [Clostridiales bacterium]|nr:hypothetical protein [Clostridiales bacterium]
MEIDKTIYGELNSLWLKNIYGMGIKKIRDKGEDLTVLYGEGRKNDYGFQLDIRDSGCGRENEYSQA